MLLAHFLFHALGDVQSGCCIAAPSITHQFSEDVCICKSHCGYLCLNAGRLEENSLGHTGAEVTQ